MDPHDPIAVYSTNDLYEAELVKQLLHDEGLVCELDGTNQGGFVELFDIKVLVRGSDESRAREILERHRATRAEETSAEETSPETPSDDRSEGE
jgi:hypothetical protein